MVFAKTLNRVTDRANEVRLEIASAADEIDDFSGKRIFKQAIDCKVPAFDVAERTVLKLNMVRATPVRVSALTAEGCHLHVGACGVGVRDEDHAKVLPHQSPVRETGEDQGRACAGRNVKVLRWDAEQAITYASADKKRRLTLVPQSPNYFKRQSFIGHLLYLVYPAVSRGAL